MPNRSSVHEDVASIVQWVATPLVQDLRTIADDAHHGIRQRGLKGDADAIAYAILRAAQCGVPDDECSILATEQFELLLRKKKRRLFVWGTSANRDKLVGAATPSSRTALPGG